MYEFGSSCLGRKVFVIKFTIIIEKILRSLEIGELTFGGQDYQIAAL